MSRIEQKSWAAGATGPGAAGAPRAVRLVDIGRVPYLDAMATFHAVAHAMDAATPDTIVLSVPDRPFVSVGFHQEVEKEVDLDYCRAHGIPIVRREVGGGAVYLDDGQLFWHTVFHRSRAPMMIDEVYRLFLAGPVAAYRAMGIEAVHRPVNDIQVGGRKIGGTGAADIGESVLVAGSLIFDFNYELMARVLRVPSEKFRDKVYQTLREYLTTIRRELGERAPTWEEGKRLLAEHFAAALGARIEPGSLTARERAEVEAVRARLASDEWTFQKGGLVRRGVKIAEGVRVVEGAHKAPGGLIRATAAIEGDRLIDVGLSGDFFFYPSNELPGLERALAGAPLEAAALSARVERFYRDHGIQAPGVAPRDFAAAVLAAAGIAAEQAS